MIMVFIVEDPLALQLRYAIVGTQFQKDFLKYMVDGNLILPRICMLKKALKTGLHVTRYLGL